MLRRDSRVPTCPVARLFESVVDEIVKQLKPETEAAAYPVIIENVTKLKESLMPKVASSLHFGSIATGTGHWCLQASYDVAITYLRCQQALAPVPKPAPRLPLTTPEQVVEDLEELIQHRSDETVLGEDTER
jgi:hypothetical protein